MERAEYADDAGLLCFYLAFPLNSAFQPQHSTFWL
jgi:hypothetical protein